MSPDLINNIATLAGVLVAALGAFVFAFWVAMGIWTFNDIRSRTRDWLAILLAVLLVMVFPIVGLILYTLIRPKATLADTYDRALEEEALLRELEETQACQSCGVPVKENWIFCPTCHSQLQHTCPACSNLVRNEWAICVYCGAPQRAAASARELGARDLQPSYAASPAARPTLEGQATPALSGASSTSGAAGLQPAPVSRRSARNPFASPSSAGTTSTAAGAAAAAPAATPPQPAPVAPAPPLSTAPTYAPLTSSDYDDTPYRPARAGEG